MAHRKDVSTLSPAQRTQFRTLLDTFINKPTANPVAEHKAAGMDMSLMIHGPGFLTWHQHFVATAHQRPDHQSDAGTSPYATEDLV